MAKGRGGNRSRDKQRNRNSATIRGRRSSRAGTRRRMKRERIRQRANQTNLVFVSDSLPKSAPISSSSSVSRAAVERKLQKLLKHLDEFFQELDGSESR